jgi:hypothetical protein
LKLIPFLKLFTNIRTAKIHPASILSLGRMGFIKDLTRKEILDYKEETITETYDIMKGVGFGHLTPELISVKGRSTVEILKSSCFGFSLSLKRFVPMAEESIS